MTILQTVVRFVRSRHAQRMRSRAFMTISDLPHHTRKDFGWPDGDGVDPRARGGRNRAHNSPQ